jgi:hypothetical protein
MPCNGNVDAGVGTRAVVPISFDYARPSIAMFEQKKSIEATTPINTAFNICFSRRKNELLNRLPSEVSFFVFLTTRFLCREVAPRPIYRTNQKHFCE